MDELDTASKAFLKRYLSTQHGHSVIPGVTPYGNGGPTGVAARGANAEGDEFDKLEAAYGNNSGTGAQSVTWHAGVSSSCCVCGTTIIFHPLTCSC